MRSPIKSSALYIVSFSLLACALAKAALPVETPRTSIERDRWRPRILLVSDRLSPNDARILDEHIFDEGIIFRCTENVLDAGVILKQLEQDGPGKWEMIFMDCRDGGGKGIPPGELATRLSALAPIVVMGQGMIPSETASGSVTGNGIYSAEYKKITDPSLDDEIVAWPLPKKLTGSLTGILKNALLAKSESWALPPAGRSVRDLARLTEQPEALQNPGSLPRVKGSAATVYRAMKGEWQFNMHPFIARHDGLFWVIWSCGRVNEDSSSQHLRYATSADGKTWSEAKILAPDPDGEKGKFQWMAGGLHVRNGKLYAYGTLHKGGGGGRVAWKDAGVHQFFWTGTEWKDEGVIMDDSLVYFAPMPLGNMEFAIRRTSDLYIYGAISPFAKNEWKMRELPGYFLRHYRMSETSHYMGPDGVLHLIIRDQGKSYRLYHSVSADRGLTWTVPVQTNYPDAVSKNLTGTFSNGWIYLVNTPVKRREMTMSLSRDGWRFDHAMLLRDDPPPRRYAGKAKNEFSYNYSHAIEHDGRLWMVYSVNKEDIEVFSFSIQSIFDKKR